MRKNYPEGRSDGGSWNEEQVIGGVLPLPRCVSPLGDIRPPAHAARTAPDATPRLRRTKGRDWRRRNGRSRCCQSVSQSAAQPLN